ncbi:MAG: ubiquinol-cytochrome c reductase iron-sulfur subunit [Gemmatimonas sp.]|jgi:thiosulfate dehydrogenase [quinone] large subunit|uniref:QcrA and Rieske domain-containing protein n=1 Tax=Gemmatimonas sp. TaxID=1962908 RepID=UPI00391F4FFE|nr:Rieske (2Fe-2S) protein [Gemmatimonadota bacterium]
MCIHRRQLLLLGATAIVAPGLVACGRATDSVTAPPASSFGPDDAVTVTGNTVDVDVSRVPAFAAATTSEVAIVFLGAQVIVVKRGAADFRALSNVCPHSGCGVSGVRPPRLVCPCHGSEFDFTGRRLEGPAPTGLQVLPATYDAATQRLRIQRLPG